MTPEKAKKQNVDNIRLCFSLPLTLFMPWLIAYPGVPLKLPMVSGNGDIIIHGF